MLKSSGIQQIKKKRRNKELGITLIALVITIIVILILAGASITMMTGDNGMLNQAVNAKEENIIGQEKEQVEMAYISATINKMGDVVTEDELQKELERLVGEKKTETIDIGDEILIVEFMDTQHCYSIEDGIVLKYVNVNVSELEKKLDEYKDIVNQINIYTESTYNDFLEQYNQNHERILSDRSSWTYDEVQWSVYPCASQQNQFPPSGHGPAQYHF